jgi:hypothetical protein
MWACRPPALRRRPAARWRKPAPGIARRQRQAFDQGQNPQTRWSDIRATRTLSTSHPRATAASNIGPKPPYTAQDFESAQFAAGISSRFQDDPRQLYLAGNNLRRCHPGRPAGRHGEQRPSVKNPSRSERRRLSTCSEKGHPGLCGCQITERQAHQHGQLRCARSEFDFRQDSSAVAAASSSA